MANALKGEVEIVAGGQTYTLVFTSNAIVQAEQLLGVSIGEIASNLMHVGNLRVLVWAGLQKNHPAIDLLSSGNVMDEFEGGMSALADPLARALRFRLSGTPLDQPLVAEDNEA